MKIEFLGNWSSNLIKGKRNVSFLVEDEYVFDFGPHSLESLFDINADISKISTVFISHMHLDHFAGLGEFLWHRANNKIDTTVVIVGPEGIKKSTERLLKIMQTPPIWLKQLKTYTNFIDGIENGSTININNANIKVFYGNHIVTDYGYRIKLKDKTIFYSGDTSYSKNIVIGAKGVDCLIHEMTYADEDMGAARYWHHSTYSDTMRTFRESGAKCLIPVHLSIKTNKIVKNESKVNKQILYPDLKIEI